MIEFLTVLGIALAMVIVYATIGIAYARRSAMRIYQEKLEWNRRVYHYTDDERRKEYAHRETRSDLSIKAMFWPMEMIGQLFIALGNGGNNLMMSPVYEREHKAAQLRRDAKTWAEVAQHPSSTASERQMAEELAKVLNQQAEEMEP